MIGLPQVGVGDLVAAGVHFGHKVSRWNPKMAPYIYGSKGGIYIIDLRKACVLLRRAMKVAYDVAVNRGRLLFVGTKIQIADVVAEHAVGCAQYYINHRWLGGTLTNFHTVSASLLRLSGYESQLVDPELVFTKKERLKLEREVRKLTVSLGGIREMGRLPDMLFVLDANRDAIAVREAGKLGIPVIAVLDTNSDPTGVTYPIPGNDDSVRSVELYCKMIAGAVLAGIQSDLSNLGYKVDQVGQDDQKGSGSASLPTPDSAAGERSSDSGMEPEAA